jgi:hypothetical protein
VCGKPEEAADEEADVQNGRWASPNKEADADEASRNGAVRLPTAAPHVQVCTHAARTVQAA